MFFAVLTVLSSLIGALTNTYMGIGHFLLGYGYLAIFVLMTLEYASLPIPSEVLLPLIGFFSAKGTFDFAIAFAIVVIAGIVGMFIDYYIAYFVGKDVVYAHASKFHISKKRLDDFDNWFKRNGKFAVFIARLVPVARGFISFPAGFAKMKKRTFLIYSLGGSLIWDIVLMLFGYYGLAAKNAYVVMSTIGVLTVVIYILYKVGMAKLKKR